MFLPTYLSNLDYLLYVVRIKGRLDRFDKTVMITGKHLRGNNFAFSLKVQVFFSMNYERKDYIDQGRVRGICEWGHVPPLKLFCV